MTEAENNELVPIYVARNNEYIRLEKEGKSREEILPLLQHYQDEINSLFPERKKPEKKNDIGDMVNIYKIIGNNASNGTYINGKKTYLRIFIKLVGYRILTSIENGEEIWELNVEPEEIDNYINHKDAAYIEMRIKN